MSFTAEFIAARRWNQDREEREAGRASCAQWREHLARLLDRAGRGDQSAFMQFYDQTSGVAYRAMRHRYDDPDVAQSATHALYLRAWDLAPRQADSGLSPLAWLLSGLADPLPTAC